MSDERDQITARPGPEDRMGAEMSDKRLIFPCGAYFQRNFDDTNWESAHREKNGAYLVTVYPGEQPYDEKRGKQAACLWGCPTPERRMEERDAHGSRINYVSCHARLHDANGSDTLDELIANVDDVTIRRHVIVPRASWYEIVRLLRGPVSQPAIEQAGTNAYCKCGHQKYLAGIICQMFACGCEKFEGVE